MALLARDWSVCDLSNRNRFSLLCCWSNLCLNLASLSCCAGSCAPRSTARRASLCSRRRLCWAISRCCLAAMLSSSLSTSTAPPPPTGNFLVVYISSDFSSFLLQALDTVVILSIGVVSSDHSHSRLISWLNCFFSFSFCTVFELFTLFTLFFFFFSFLFLILLLYAKNSFTSPPRQHVYGFPPGHIPQVFPGHFEKFLDAFGAGACRCYVRYTPLANVAFGRVSYTSVPAHRMKSAFLIQSSDFIVQTIFVAILTDSPLVVQAIYGQREWFHTKMFQQLFIGLGEIVRTHAVHRSMTIFIVLLVQVLLRSWH